MMSRIPNLSSSLKNAFVSLKNSRANSNAVAVQNLRNEWKSVIGLEIHAQLSTKTKLFSSAPSDYGLPTNDAVALFDAALPGTLPRLNKKAVELAVISALTLGCKVNPNSEFDRKHYFYFDLPSGYQITQQRLPLAENGEVEYAVYQPGVHKEPYYKKCRIKQIQLEQDSGKALHEEFDKKNYIDLNRAGVALIEIVFQPDVRNGEEACALVKEVISILERAGSCSCKLEEGAFRVDANVSLSKSGDDSGVRTEIKNIGTIHGVANAIEHEIDRQLNIISQGGIISNVTLAWDSVQNKTVEMRDKEDKQDYRFMPEPNLPPLRLLIDEYSEHFHKTTKSKSSIFDLRHLKNKIPELPQTERRLLTDKYELDTVFAYNLVNQNKLFKYFVAIMEENSSRDPKAVYLVLMYNLLHGLKKMNLELNDCPLSAKYLGQIVDLLHKKRISKVTGEWLLEKLLKEPDSPCPVEMVEKHNLSIITREKELRKICLRVVEKERNTVALYKRKKRKSLFNDLVGKAIEESRFRADTKLLPSVMVEVLEEVLREK